MSWAVVRGEGEGLAGAEARGAGTPDTVGGDEATGASGDPAPHAPKVVASTTSRQPISDFRILSPRTVTAAPMLAGAPGGFECDRHHDRAQGFHRVRQNRLTAMASTSPSMTPRSTLPPVGTTGQDR
ncbi:hypothetical protein GCM10022204_08360 [Microlunatus aurantiacus]|uniref:Uncharacterized protein n=1 Tax=Microlunatus aurantiacus TaxID=446786 RepID=A0ABP7CT81_9ACTN